MKFVCLPAGTVRVLVATEIWPGLQLSLVEEGEELGDLLGGGEEEGQMRRRRGGGEEERRRGSRGPRREGGAGGGVME